MMEEKEKEENRGRRGSALGVVIVIMMVMMILVTAALSLTASYGIRTQRYHNRIQAQLTARTTAEVVARDLQDKAKPGSIRSIIENLIDEELKAVLTVEGLDEQMGEVTLEAAYDKDTDRLEITVSTVLNEAEEEITIVFDYVAKSQKTAEGGEETGSWKLVRFEDGK